MVIAVLYYLAKRVLPTFFSFLLVRTLYSQTACNYRPNTDNPSWTNPSHWVCLSSVALCDGDSPKYPVANDDVTSNGYNILVSGISRTVNNITMTAGNSFPAKLTVEGGATFTCNNMTISSHSSSTQEASLIIYDNNTVVQVNGNLTFTKPATNSSTAILGLFMASTAAETPTLNVAGNLVFNHLNGALGSGGVDNDSIEFSVAGTSTVNVEGSTTFTNELGYTRIKLLSNAKVNWKGATTLTRQSSTGSLQIILEDNAELTIGTTSSPADLIVANSGTPGAGRDVIIDIEGNAKMTVNGDMTVNHTAGDDFVLALNPTAALGSKAKLNVSGNLNINTSSNADDTKITALQDSSYITIGESFNFVSNSPDTRLELTLDKGGRIACGANFSVTQTQGSGVLITTNATASTPSPSIAVIDTFQVKTITSSFFTTIDLNRGSLTAGTGILSLAGGNSLRFYLDGSSQAQFTGNVTATRTGGDSVVIEVGQNPASSTAQLTIGGKLTLDNDVSTSNRWVFLKGYQNASITVSGDIEMQAKAQDQTRVQLENNSILRMAGNFKRPEIFGYLAMYDSTTLELIGTQPQYVIGNDTVGNGTDFNNYKRLVINNTATTYPQVTLTSDTEIESRLVFNNGLIGSSPSRMLVVIDNAQAGSGTVSTFTNNDGGKANSFVVGTLRKVGDDEFIFPVGDTSGSNLFWAPIGIIAPSGTATFEANYRNSRPSDYNSLGAGLMRISGREYWNLDRTSGTASARVRLYWKDASRSMIDDIASSDLRIAHYNGTQWQQFTSTILGGSTVGSGGNGAITTNSALTSFSPFTFGSNSPSVNPLPTHLLRFQAERKGNTVQLQYTVSQTTSNEIVKIQKSYNGYDWIDMTQNQHYFYTDTETSQAYYRLAFCEASCSYSTALFVGGIGSTISVFMSHDELFIEGLEGNNDVEVCDINGKVLLQTTTTESRLALKRQFVAGVYLISITSEEGKIHRFKYIMR